MYRYVAGWVTAGLAVITVTVLVLGETGSSLPAEDRGIAVIFLVATVVAGTLAVGLRTREGIHRVSFIEAAVVACLVALHDVGWAVLVITAGLVVTEILGRRPFVKAAYNVASIAVATTVAAAITVVIRGSSDPLGWRGILGVTVAMIVFGVVNLAAIRGLMHRLRPGRAAKEDDEAYRASALRLSLLGNTAIGILGAFLAMTQPWLLPLLLVPLATLYLANEGIGRTSALLRRSESERNRLDRIVQGVSDGVAFLDDDGHVELWSPATERLTGVPAAGAVGARLGDLVTVRLDGRRIDPLEAAADARPDTPSVSVPGDLERPDGVIRHVEFHLTVVYDDGEPEGVVVLIRDVTRERELERAKDDFLMRISHELRTPLTPIRGYAESLRIHRERVTPDLLERSLERIEERAVHMTRLVDDLLMVANLGTGDTHVASDDLRLVEPVLNAAARLTQSDESHRVGIEVAHDHVVFADEARVTQILAALVDNAARYSPADSPIVLRSYTRRNSVVLEVVDEGRGIPPDHVERIFERFHRVEDPLKMTTAGVGLGLYLARRLAESMGGALTCRSQLGVGSTFALTLPRGRGAPRPDADDATGGETPADDATAEAR